MTILSDAQIAAVAADAGFSGDALVIAIAIAKAESSGNADVINFLGCVGLWQVYQSVHASEHPEWTTSWLQVPANNATAAYELSSGGRNWVPWETYTNGMYLAYLDEAAVAAGAPDGTGVPTGESVPAGTVTVTALAPPGIVATGLVATYDTAFHPAVVALSDTRFVVAFMGPDETKADGPAAGQTVGQTYFQLWDDQGVEVPPPWHDPAKPPNPPTVLRSDYIVGWDSAGRDLDGGRPYPFLTRVSDEQFILWGVDTGSGTTVLALAARRYDISDNRIKEVTPGNVSDILGVPWGYLHASYQADAQSFYVPSLDTMVIVGNGQDATDAGTPYAFSFVGVNVFGDPLGPYAKWSELSPPLPECNGFPAPWVALVNEAGDRLTLEYGYLTTNLDGAGDYIYQRYRWVWGLSADGVYQLGEPELVDGDDTMHWFGGPAASSLQDADFAGADYALQAGTVKVPPEDPDPDAFTLAVTGRGVPGPVVTTSNTPYQGWEGGNLAFDVDTTFKGLIDVLPSGVGAVLCSNFYKNDGRYGLMPIRVDVSKAVEPTSELGIAQAQLDVAAAEAVVNFSPIS